MKKSKNVKRTLLSLLTITALCSSGFFMACSDSDDDSGNTTQNTGNNGSGNTGGNSSETGSQPSVDPVTGGETETDYTIADGTLTYKSTASLKNITLPAFDVTDADLFTISLDATFATDQSDWAAQLLKTSDNYIITIPNLDPWNNTAETSAIKSKNGFPTAAGAYLANSLIFSSAFTGAKVAITVSLNKKDKTIVYTLNGKAWVVYSAAVWDGGIEEFITAFANALKAGTLSFNPNSLEYSSLVITKGQATSAEVKEILLEKATVTTDIAGLNGVISDIKGYAVYSDGSASTITQATEGLSLAYTNSQNEAVTQPDSEGKYTVKVTYGGVDTTFSLVIGSPNKVSGTGTVEDPYVLTTTLAETIQGKEGAIDAYKYQSQTTQDTSATVSWKSPLYGLEAGSLPNGITISADVYSANLDGVNGYDALLTFFKDPTDGWNCLSIMEGGAVHINSGAIGGYFDNVSSLKKGEWVKVSLVFGTDGTLKYYQNGTAIEGAIAPLEGSIVSYDTIVNYFTTTAQNIAVGVGFASGGNGLWKAGFVDNGSAIANIKVYSTALTADQVAAIN
ncbi:hypothetical protein [uncultured Treponema sp.]|uniref:hypothetical protein n=1 Tax=uncultured Treponema sp. TaxID=162155 RepID=UPI0025E2F667|nr:hypothetical protein [uncultured Treponema sp.]